MDLLTHTNWIAKVLEFINMHGKHQSLQNSQTCWKHAALIGDEATINIFEILQVIKNLWKPYKSWGFSKLIRNEETLQKYANVI